jgi:hypothetical protein
MKYVILALIFLLLASWPLARQFETGAIEGFITGSAGPVAGASVEARHSIRGDVARATSDAAGFYRVDGLRAGIYSLWIAADGYCSVQMERIPVERGQAVRRDVRMSRIIDSICRPSGESISTVHP